ncbi:MAG: copper amine oxidase N-terminal domain-containing protein [Armatimonadetes bacterium]|nr:copper amine oxidase N-terminal domain-containing protein [Armatimonadota bacterium]
MRRLAPLAFTLALVLALPSVAMAQPISVTLDGRPLGFDGAGPQMVRGRVLVPMRGIFEALGAGVTWDGANQIVSATRAETNVLLRIGSRTAQVNGRAVSLDVPAMLVRDTTMVPLRFVSESLNAQVGWDEASQTVAVTTHGVTDPPVVPPPTTTTAVAPEISSFTHDADRWLNSGSTLHVVLLGTPGGQASFTVPGLVKAAPLVEVAGGRYEGSWRPTSGQIDLTVAGAAVIGTLRSGTQTAAIQSARTLSVDTQPPLISAVTPLPDSQLVPQPIVSAVFDDRVGSGVDPTTVRLTLDSADITEQAVVTSSFVSFRPVRPLPAEEHLVAVSAADRAGNRVSRSWRFRTIVVADGVRAFRWTAPAGAGPGDTVSITLDAPTGGQARCSVGTVVANQAMPEVTTGHYAADYTLRRSDQLALLRVSGTFTTREGQAYTFEAENQSAVVAPVPGTTLPVSTALVVPRFTSPSPDTRIGASVVLRGTGPRNGRVGVRVEYVTKVLGLLPVGGALTEVAVDVDRNGNWQTASINVDTLLSGGGTTYNVTAWSVGLDNQRSASATLRLMRQ